MLGMSVQLQPSRSVGILSVTLRHVELNGSRPASLGKHASNMKRSTDSRRTALLQRIYTYIYIYIYLSALSFCRYIHVYTRVCVSM